MARTRLLGMLLLLAAVLPLRAADPPATDLRVLIDVSGSMKQNDPNNLRVPAMRLLVGLMPDGIRAGVWSFGRYVNMDVKLGIVDGVWKRQADQAARKIHSRGLYTNIEEALRRATRDWKEPPPEGVERHLILLTDGMVDVSRDPAEDAESRRRVLEELLPAILAGGGHIHTIALSANADTELLQTLSNRTDGWYEQVEDAEALQRIFLRLFESSVKPDSVPLEGNAFVIDESISDMTVLAFHAPDQTSTRLKSPDGTLWSSDDHPPGVEWLHQQHYDMITVDSPPAGEWLIEGELDPDNRVMVVTNLRLEAAPFPANLLMGDPLPVTAWLMQGGERVTDRRFLSLSRFYLRQEGETGEPVIWPLADEGGEGDERAGDGVFSARLGRSLLPGSYEIAVNAYGPTYKRELRRSVKVHDVPFRVDLQLDESGRKVRVEMTTTPGLLKDSSVRIRMTAGDGTEFPLPLVEKRLWRATLPLAFAGPEIRLELRALRNDGTPYEVQLVRRVPGATQGVTPQESDEQSPPAEPAPPPAAEEDEAGNEAAGLSPAMKIGISIGVGNLILALAGFFGWRLWKRQKAADALIGESLEGLESEEESAPPPAGSGAEEASGEEAEGASTEGEAPSAEAEDPAAEEPPSAGAEEVEAAGDAETESMIEEELDLAAAEPPEAGDGTPSSADGAAGETEAVAADAAEEDRPEDPPGEGSEATDSPDPDDLAAQWEAMLDDGAGDPAGEGEEEPPPGGTAEEESDAGADDLAAQWEAMLGEGDDPAVQTAGEEDPASAETGESDPLAAEWEAMLDGEETEGGSGAGSLPGTGESGDEEDPPAEGRATGTADPKA